MPNDIIPFGKYKGQNVLSLANDKSYTDWLVSQPWFRSDHTNIYNIIVNNFREVDNTPEHNKIQIKFLDSTFSLKLAFLLYPGLFHWNPKTTTEELKKYISKNTFTTADLEKIIATANQENLLAAPDPSFENGHDVSYYVAYGLDLELELKSKPYFAPDFIFNHKRYINILIEIKPTIGDDFPAVLRQMKASMPKTMFDNNDHSPYKKYRCLLLREYTGESASREQFIKYFNSQGYKVIFLSDINSIELPIIENRLSLTKENLINTNA